MVSLGQQLWEDNMGKSTKHGQKCPNGHTANSEGKCFDATCEYYVRKGQ